MILIFFSFIISLMSSQKAMAVDLGIIYLSRDGEKPDELDRENSLPCLTSRKGWERTVVDNLIHKLA